MAFLDASLIRLKETISEPQAAIRSAGRLLRESNYVEARYVEAMVAAYEQHGPYFVISPGIAVPHARPEDGVIRPAVSMIQITKGIRFGSKANDPVYLIFALAADSNQHHLELLQKLSRLLGKEENIIRLKKATTLGEIQNLLKGDSI
ncbi:PTS system IIA component (L-Asc family) [Melghirimyces profundicolus]|uniref:PTS system IIA component (L-Asc family) n=1 Tax=Melghirimyces profundicolus TaxID=1242148 RepID=A0A2T6BR30_9BACL|nr:PTS sugar transporter subunit IIA [Melghirimyces profundicolus]PTX58494.1 PTS system IIA component (L-Asc family) [Melghirimyces profundicolus]